MTSQQFFFIREKNRRYDYEIDFKKEEDEN
jgi:hypothetical protein